MAVMGSASSASGADGGGSQGNAMAKGLVHGNPPKSQPMLEGGSGLGGGGMEMTAIREEREGA